MASEQGALFDARPPHRLMMLPALPPGLSTRFAGSCLGCDATSPRLADVDLVVAWFRGHAVSAYTRAPQA